MTTPDTLLGRRFAWDHDGERLHLLVVGLDPDRGVRLRLEEDSRVAAWVDPFTWARLYREVLKGA